MSKDSVHALVAEYNPDVASMLLLPPCRISLIINFLSRLMIITLCLFSPFMSSVAVFVNTTQRTTVLMS